MTIAAIHSTAIIAPEASIAEGVTVGAYCVIGNVEIGSGTVVHPHVVIADGATIGQQVEIFPGAFIGKEPKGAGATARTPRYEKFVLIGDHCSIGPNAVLYYDVVIGSATLIGDGASIREQCRIGAKCIISRFVSINYDTQIGDRVKVMDGTHLTGNMTIEDDVFVSALVVTVNDNVVSGGYANHVVGPKVGAGAIIGGGATLMPGTTIGAKAIVAAGALVTKDVPPGGRVAGLPARDFPAR